VLVGTSYFLTVSVLFLIELFLIKKRVILEFILLLQLLIVAII